jgi:hypothetical protein
MSYHTTLSAAPGTGLTCVDGESTHDEPATRSGRVYFVLVNGGLFYDESTHHCGRQTSQPSSATSLSQIGSGGLSCLSFCSVRSKTHTHAGTCFIPPIPVNRCCNVLSCLVVVVISRLSRLSRPPCTRYPSPLWDTLHVCFESRIWQLRRDKCMRSEIFVYSGLTAWGPSNDRRKKLPCDLDPILMT